MRFWKVALVVALCLGLFVQPAAAATFVLNAQDSGWYDDGGSYFMTNKNYLAGWRATEYRNYFVFDLTPLPPLPTITSVVLRLEQPASGYASPDATETFELVDVITPVPVLEANGIMALTTYQDLGEGTVYGSLAISGATNGTLVDIPLDPSRVAAVQGAVGLFAIGGHVTTLVSGFDVETTWGFTGETSVRQLIVTTADPSTTTTSSTTSTTSPSPSTTSSSSTSTIVTSTTTTTAFSCGSGPQAGCQAAAPQRARLQLGRGRLSWKWTSSATVTIDALGAPTTSSNYLLCVYDAAGPKLSAEAPAGGTCGTRPCWRAVGSAGFRYRDRAGTPDGLTGIRLKPGAAERARLQAKGSGASLTLPALPLTTPLVVQLRRSDGSTCWDATYNNTLRNDAIQFKAKSD